MDSTVFEGSVLDPSKYGKLSMEEKKQLVYEISDWSQGAPEILQTWARQDIIQILCTETGKERKYVGLSKPKIIEILLELVAEKKSQRAMKKQKKTATDNSLIDINDCDSDSTETKLCKNLACRAKLSQEDAFCKRCSCCICHQYDDNKDPSLWLTCSSEYLYHEKACGFSCHLECALQHEKSGIRKDGNSKGLDGCFYCISCGKVNDLLQCWRKQMITARDTRVVDILCYRVFLAHKLLIGTVRYGTIHKIVNEIIQKLEADVGPLTGLLVKQARGIVNRLASGQEVQRLCAFALDSVDSILSNTHDPVVKENEKVKRSQSLATNSGSFSNPSSVEDENNNIVVYKDTSEKQTDKFEEQQKIVPDNVDTSVQNAKEFDQFLSVTKGELPFTRYKAESSKDETFAIKSTPEPSKTNLDDGSSKKRSSEEVEDRDFGYYVKVIRWLECKEHIDKSFRQKFLTWYSLRADPQEVRIVKVFVDTFMEEPSLLAEQLIDTFSEVIASKKCSKGLCLKLFH
ncbi:VIN3-like protein 2 [Rutidosis leptorrhynchoides]|uniref:VIN3-like protein 2 n=1 Tax=Rutidosis leptorrhynchoides TaxID=125765 RepID=UPI003A99B958